MWAAFCPRDTRISARSPEVLITAPALRPRLPRRGGPMPSPPPRPCPGVPKPGWPAHRRSSAAGRRARPAGRGRCPGGPSPAQPDCGWPGSPPSRWCSRCSPGGRSAGAPLWGGAGVRGRRGAGGRWGLGKGQGQPRGPGELALGLGGDSGAGRAWTADPGRGHSSGGGPGVGGAVPSAGHRGRGSSAGHPPGRLQPDWA